MQMLKVYYADLSFAFGCSEQVVLSRVDTLINDPISEMLAAGWRIVSYDSKMSNQTKDSSPCLLVSVLFEKG